MKIILAAVGKKRGGPEAALVEDYIDRAQGFGRRLGVSDIALVEVEAPRALEGAVLKKREGELLLAALPPGAPLIALDERGDNIDSAGFAAMLAAHRDQGAAAMMFAIGGADGHGEELRSRAARRIAFGAATWPHLLVRAMLAEQLYRAMTILSGHPYHRA